MGHLLRVGRVQVGIGDVFFLRDEFKLSSIMLIQNQAEAAKSLGISPESQAPHSFVWS